MRSSLAYILLVLCFHLAIASANYEVGEIIPTSRRGQYQGSRTIWHDLMGRHCPRFAKDSKVAIPIPEPANLQARELAYKIQFAFDDRLYSPWIQIIGKNLFGAPVVLMELEHIGNVLKSVNAQVVPVTQEYLKEYQQILREFQNATLWPKHLLLHYTWKHTNPININAGLYFIFATGIIMTGVLGLSIIISYQEKLKAFVSDMTLDLDDSSKLQSRSTWQKAD